MNQPDTQKTNAAQKAEEAAHDLIQETDEAARLLADEMKKLRSQTSEKGVEARQRFEEARQRFEERLIDLRARKDEATARGSAALEQLKAGLLNSREALRVAFQEARDTLKND